MGLVFGGPRFCSPCFCSLVFFRQGFVLPGLLLTHFFSPNLAAPVPGNPDLAKRNRFSYEEPTRFIDIQVPCRDGFPTSFSNTSRPNVTPKNNSAGRKQNNTGRKHRPKTGRKQNKNNNTNINTGRQQDATDLLAYLFGGLSLANCGRGRY